MKTNDLNFIEIKTKRSPISSALNSITVQKLKPFYNTVYQLFNLKNQSNEPYQQVVLRLQQKINNQMPKIIMNRLINQETLQFRIVKPLQKRGFSNETSSSRSRKCKSVSKSYFLTNLEQKKHKKKDEMGQKFNKLRNLSKTLSQSTIQNKKRYNILDKYHKIIDHHYSNLQLQHQYIVDDEQDSSLINKSKSNRYKLESNKWIQNILVSNDEQHAFLLMKQKDSYFRRKAIKLNLYKGITDKQLKECKEIIQKDNQLMELSFHHTISTTDISQVKSIYEFNRKKLTTLINQYKTQKYNTPNRSLERPTKSLKPSPNRNAFSPSYNYNQYQKFKNSQNQNPQTYRIGDKYSNFQSKSQKKALLLKLKQHQKIKYNTKVMDVKLHKKLFLKQK